MCATEKKHHDQERAEHRRRQVLDAAEGCFSRSGFHGASMAEISKAAGMSAGHIYNYFASKDEIIAVFVQRNVERVSALMRDLEERDDPLQAMIEDTAKNIHEKLTANPCTLPLEMLSEGARNERIGSLMREADGLARAEFRRVLKKGREMRGLSVDDAVLEGRIEVVFAFYQGLDARVVHNPALSEAALASVFRVALAALLFSE